MGFSLPAVNFNRDIRPFFKQKRDDKKGHRQACYTYQQSHGSCTVSDTLSASLTWNDKTSKGLKGIPERTEITYNRPRQEGTKTSLYDYEWSIIRSKLEQIFTGYSNIENLVSINQKRKSKIQQALNIIKNNNETNNSQELELAYAYLMIVIKSNLHRIPELILQELNKIAGDAPNQKLKDNLRYIFKLLYKVNIETGPYSSNITKTDIYDEVGEKLGFLDQQKNAIIVDLDYNQWPYSDHDF